MPQNEAADQDLQCLPLNSVHGNRTPLRGVDTHGRFSAILQGRQLLFKGSTLKGKSRFFPFRIDTFSDGRQKQYHRIVSLESGSTHLKLCGSDFIFEPTHYKTNKMACVPSEDSDQPGHPLSLISIRCAPKR